jgi:hypothetical protein
LHKVLSVLPVREMRFEYLRAKVHVDSPDLVDALLEGEWLGLVEIGDRDETPKYWTVRRVGR